MSERMPPEYLDDLDADMRHPNCKGAGPALVIRLIAEIRALRGERQTVGERWLELVMSALQVGDYSVASGPDEMHAAALDSIAKLCAELELEKKFKTEALYQAELEAERATTTRARAIAEVVSWLRANPAISVDHAADALASGALEGEGE